MGTHGLDSDSGRRGLDRCWWPRRVQRFRVKCRIPSPEKAVKLNALEYLEFPTNSRIVDSPASAPVDKIRHLIVHQHAIKLGILPSLAFPEVVLMEVIRIIRVRQEDVARTDRKSTRLNSSH